MDRLQTIYKISILPLLINYLSGIFPDVDICALLHFFKSLHSLKRVPVIDRNNIIYNDSHESLEETIVRRRGFYRHDNGYEDVDKMPLNWLPSLRGKNVMEIGTGAIGAFAFLAGLCGCKQYIGAELTQGNIDSIYKFWQKSSSDLKSGPLPLKILSCTPSSWNLSTLDGQEMRGQIIRQFDKEQIDYLVIRNVLHHCSFSEMVNIFEFFISIFEQHERGGVFLIENNSVLQGYANIKMMKDFHIDEFNIMTVKREDGQKDRYPIDENTYTGECLPSRIVLSDMYPKYRDEYLRTGKIHGILTATKISRMHIPTEATFKKIEKMFDGLKISNMYYFDADSNQRYPISKYDKLCEIALTRGPYTLLNDIKLIVEMTYLKK